MIIQLTYGKGKQYFAAVAETDKVYKGFFLKDVSYGHPSWEVNKLSKKDKRIIKEVSLAYVNAHLSQYKCSAPPIPGLDEYERQAERKKLISKARKLLKEGFRGAIEDHPYPVRPERSESEGFDEYYKSPRYEAWEHENNRVYKLRRESAVQYVLNRIDEGLFSEFDIDIRRIWY